MADRRKLQGEVDKCLKKVDEGVEIFEDIWKKVQTSTNSNQKEKFESDLKKEIKKLQRLRDQIKSWITNSDIKDKSSLLEHRKLIEMQMERFKVVERETKTKVYSKDGLGAAKLDPQTKEKADVIQWISNMLNSLHLQLDQFECELEARTGANKKKGKDSRCDALKQQQERHKFHTQTLEKIMRQVDNDTLPVDKIRELRDDIEHYVESNQDPNFRENIYLYDELDLDEFGTDAPPQALTPSDNDDVLIDKITDNSSSVYPRSHSPNSSVIAKHSIMNQEVGRKRHKSQSDEKIIPSPAPSSISRLSPSLTKLSSQTIINAQKSDNIVMNGSQTKLTTLLPLSAAGSQRRGSLGSSKHSVNTVDHTSASSSLNKIVSSKTNTETPRASPGNQFVLRASSPLAGTVTPATNTLSKLSFEAHNSQSECPPTVNGPFNTTEQQKPEVDLSLKNMAQKVVANVELERGMASVQTLVDSSGMLTSNRSESPRQHSPFAVLEQNSDRVSDSLPYAEQQQPSLPHLSSIHLNPLLGVVPLGPMQLGKKEYYQAAMLDASFHHLPHPADSDRVRSLVRAPCPTPQYYPSASVSHVNTAEIFQRCATETLFFAFYYMEGTKAQYLAAKALKRQAWRFHTRYMTWFQRHEEPRQVTDEFELGTYLYFDYEKWAHRKKEGFTFEYKYLEDSDLA